MSSGGADRGPLIRAYFESCNSGSPGEIAAHFTDEAVIYDTNHGPVRTAAGIGRFWEKIRAQWQGAVWQVDHVVSDGDVAAIEWNMAGDGERGRFVFRGSEHYAFDGDLIAEIRQYWNFDRTALDTGLVGYPYPNEDGERETVTDSPPQADSPPKADSPPQADSPPKADSPPQAE